MKTSFVTPKYLERLRGSPLWPHVEAYIELGQAQGYSWRSYLGHLRVVAAFGGWLQRTRTDLRDVSEETLQRFLTGGRFDRSYRIYGSYILRRLLGGLRSAGIVRPARTERPSALKQWCERYRQYLSQERGLATITVQSYVWLLERFLRARFGTGRIRLSSLKAHDVTGFVQRFGQHCGPKRAATAVTALRSFLRFLHYRGHLDRDLSFAVPMVATWRATNLPKALPAGAVQHILDACDKTTSLGRRNYAILLLLARLGLRACEIANLLIDDIDWEKAELTIRSKKSARAARLPLPVDVGRALARYLRHDRPRCALRHVFVRAVAPHCAFSVAKGVVAVARKAIRRAGIQSPTYGSHVFRHSLATEMLRRGASLEEIGRVLRHQNLDSTSVYAKVDLNALRPLAMAWPGGGQ